MQRAKHRHFRNRVDMADRVQVRVIKRRLRLSEPELNQLVDRVGNSIAAISKEVSLRKAGQPNPLGDLTSAAPTVALADREPEHRTEPLSPAA